MKIAESSLKNYMFKIVTYFKRKFKACISETKDFMLLLCDFIFEEPRYLFPLRFIAIIFLIFINIGNIRINLFSSEFKDWFEFDAHMWKIMNTLTDAGHPEWANELRISLYVSQSFYERKGELLLVLRPLLRQKFTKALMIKKDVKKAISYLKSI